MIREFQSDDTEAVISVWRSASDLAHPFLTDAFMAQGADDIRNIYLPNAETWVLEEGDRLIGFIALVGDEIGGLFLDPSSHGKGFGRALVDHAIGRKGPLRVEVFQKNAIGRRFYERYGFVEAGVYRHEASGEMTFKMVMPSS